MFLFLFFFWERISLCTLSCNSLCWLGWPWTQESTYLCFSLNDARVSTIRTWRNATLIRHLLILINFVSDWNTHPPRPKDKVPREGPTLSVFQLTYIPRERYGFPQIRAALYTRNFYHNDHDLQPTQYKTELLDTCCDHKLEMWLMWQKKGKIFFILFNLKRKCP